MRVQRAGMHTGTPPSKPAPSSSAPPQTSCRPSSPSRAGSAGQRQRRVRNVCCRLHHLHDRTTPYSHICHTPLLPGTPVSMLSTTLLHPARIPTPTCSVAADSCRNSPGRGSRRCPAAAQRCSQARLRMSQPALAAARQLVPLPGAPAGQKESWRRLVSSDHAKAAPQLQAAPGVSSSPFATLCHTPARTWLILSHPGL